MILAETTIRLCFLSFLLFKAPRSCANRWGIRNRRKQRKLRIHTLSWISCVRQLHVCSRSWSLASRCALPVDADRAAATPSVCRAAV